MTTAIRTERIETFEQAEDRIRRTAERVADQEREPAVLRPYHYSEAMSVAEAAKKARKSVRTVRLWCEEKHIGRRCPHHWQVSRIALQMVLEGDERALAAYLSGDRSSELVAGYFEQLNLPHLLQRK